MLNRTRAVVALAFLISMSYLVASCGKVDELTNESAAWRNQVDQSVKRLESAMDKAVLGIPGERYLRLIDAVNDPGSSPEEVARAKELVKRLFDVEIDGAYELSLHFGYDETKPLEALFTFLPANSPAAVEYYCLNRGTYNAEPVRNTLRRPPNWEQVDAYIDAKLLAAIEELGAQVSNPKVIRNSMGPSKTQFTLDKTSAVDITQIIGGAGNRFESFGSLTIEDIEKSPRRRAAAAHLRAALNAIYGDLALPLSAATFTRDFLPLGGRPFLVVMIEKEMIEQQPADRTFEVQAIVYKKLTGEEKKRVDKGEHVTRVALNSQHPIEFNKEHFEANPPISCGNPARTVYYAAHNMTDAETMTRELYDAYLQTRELTRSWEASQRGEATQ